MSTDQYLDVVMPEKKALIWVVKLVKLTWIPIVFAIISRWTSSYLNIVSLSLITFATVQMGKSTQDGIHLPKILENWLAQSSSPVINSLWAALIAIVAYSLIEIFVSWTYTWIHLIINKKVTPEVIETSINHKEGFSLEASTAIQRWLLKTDVVYILYESIAATLGNIGTIFIAVFATYKANSVAGHVSAICLGVWFILAIPLTIKALQASRNLAQSNEIVGRRIRDSIALATDLSRPSLKRNWLEQSSGLVDILQRSIAIQGFWKAILPGCLHVIATITPYIAVMASIASGAGAASFAILLYLTRITRPLSSLSDILPWFQQNLISVQRLFDIVVKQHQPINQRTEQVWHRSSLSLHNWTVRVGNEKCIVFPEISTSDKSILCIVGPSGSGKSTLLKSIAGMQHIESGELKLDDSLIDPKSSIWHETCSILPQEPELIPGTIRQNLNEFVDWSSTEVIKIVLSKLLENIANKDKCIVGIDNKGVSVGQRRTIGLLRCLGGSAGVLLLDEPVAGVDDSLVHSIRDALVETQKHGRIIILSAHEHDYRRLKLSNTTVVRLSSDHFPELFDD